MKTQHADCGKRQIIALAASVGTGIHMIGAAVTHGMMRRVPLAMLAAIACLDPVTAELPMIQTQPNLGYFVVFMTGKMDFRVKAQSAEMVLGALANKRTPMGWPLAVTVVIEEIQPSGQANPVQVQSFDSTDPATEKLKKVVIAGKTVGNAAFEMTLEKTQGAIAIGGHMLNQGSHSNPLRFTIRTDFPNFYVSNLRGTEAEKKTYQNVIKKDHIALKWSTGEHKKLASDASLDAAAKDINGPGIATAEINVALYTGTKFLFNASSDSAMHLTTAKPGPWLEGFSLIWTPNSATAKDGKARLMLEVK
jgi:hypothetical protein